MKFHRQRFIQQTITELYKVFSGVCRYFQSSGRFFNRLRYGSLLRSKFADSFWLKSLDYCLKLDALILEILISQLTFALDNARILWIWFILNVRKVSALEEAGEIKCSMTWIKACACDILMLSYWVVVSCATEKFELKLDPGRSFLPHK